MGTDNKTKRKANNSNNNSKKRKNYLPHNKPVKKGSYPLRPGVEGFFVTCDGGREYQASNEAIDVIDSFYEELVDGVELKTEQAEVPAKPKNKVIKFASSDSDDDEAEKDGRPKDSESVQVSEYKNEEQTKDGVSTETKTEEKQEAEAVEPPIKKQCVELDASNHQQLAKKVQEKSVDDLIEEELAELKDKSKRRFIKLDTGCNGVLFIQMRKKDGDPSPKDIVQHMMMSLVSTKKHVARFLLRMLPVEVSCYTSEEEIRRAITPVIEKYFPVETETPRKFAVLYDARANTGIDRKKIIDSVAKCVPSTHKVDLGNPDIHIVVQIVKTVCLIGVVEKYKDLAKYNLRQLTTLPETE